MVFEKRSSAAESLDSAAEAFRAGGARVAGAADRAGDALASGAKYVRERDAWAMLSDLVGLVKANPGPALFGAVTLGFVVGRALYRK